MKTSPIFFILHGLLARSSFDVPPPHVVVGSTCDQQIIQVSGAAQKICFTFDRGGHDGDETTHIFLPRLIEGVIQENKAIPIFHKFSFHHFSRYENSKLSSVMGYPTYCLLEEKIADIVFSYINDAHHHWMIMIDPFFMHRDGFRSYALHDEKNNALWVTPSVDLDGDDIIVDVQPEDTGII